MKNLISYAALLGLGLTITPSTSFAQNYIPPSAYGGPNVVVNMDVLGGPGSMNAPTPLTSRPSGLRSRSEAAANVPLRLRRPAATHHATIARSAPMPSAQAPLVLKQPAARQITSAPLAPLSPRVDPTITAPVPEFAANTKPSFSAKELVKAVEPAPLTKPALIATPKKEVVKAVDETKTRQRELLAKAREDVLYDDNKAKEVVEAAKADTEKMAERTIAEIEDIAPSAPKIMAQPKAIAPMPPVASLDRVVKAPVVEAPVVKAPAIPNFVDEAQKEIEKPMEVAALAEPKLFTPAVPTPPVTSSPVEAMSSEGQDSFRLLFGGQSADLSQNYVNVLDQVATRLNNTKDAKIQLRAFADGTPETTSKARRLSLTRALTVRSYLLDKGVSATSMDVRALGVAPVQADTSPDRVDIVFVR